MRGRFFHNDVLLAPAVRFFRRHGADVRCEHPVALGNARGFVDAFVVWLLWRIVLEAERDPRRVAKDVAKALALKADLLLIIVPDWRVARSARNRLEKIGVPAAPSVMAIWILPLGPAMKRLSDLMSFSDSAQCLTDINPFNPARGGAERGSR